MHFSALNQAIDRVTTRPANWRSHSGRSIVQILWREWDGRHSFRKGFGRCSAIGSCPIFIITDGCNLELLGCPGQVSSVTRMMLILSACDTSSVAISPRSLGRSSELCPFDGRWDAAHVCVLPHAGHQQHPDRGYSSCLIHRGFQACLIHHASKACFLPSTERVLRRWSKSRTYTFVRRRGLSECSFARARLARSKRCSDATSRTFR